MNWDENGLPYTNTNQEIYTSFSDAFNESGFYQHTSLSTFTKSDGTSTNILDLVITEDKERILELEYLPPLGSIKHAYLCLVWTYSVRAA